MSGMRAFRAVAVVAAVGGSLLAAPGAQAAGPYAIDAHVDAPATPPGPPPPTTAPPPPAGGFSYTPTSFRWNEPFEVTFTHLTDVNSAALMGLAQGHREVPTAIIHETLGQTAVVTLAMSNVRVEVVHEEGNVNNSNGPEETVVLRFRTVVYTYQPVTPTGQKAGAPVTITYSEGGGGAKNGK
jgi:hypothetical protein